MLHELLCEALGDRRRADVARAISVPRSTLTCWLTGRWRPRPDRLQAFLDACQATPEMRDRVMRAFSGLEEAA